MNIPKLGFGGYRVDHRIEEHFLSLKKAVLAGITLIDTSANYADGNSEILIGNVLDELYSEGNIKREDITLVTKVGYIQGQNQKQIQMLIASGHQFDEITRLDEHLWHCIHPEFIKNQIEHQLTRTNTDYIDVYLLHNPEYYLKGAKENGLDISEARQEYYRRIKNALQYMEELADKGLVKYYGISSNTFVTDPDEYDFTSLEDILEISNSVSKSGRFKFIQLPFNLFEIGAVINKNQNNRTKSVLELASENKLNVLINRPLNAITSKGLVRLAEFHSKPPDEKEFIRQIQKVKLLEDDFIKEKLANYPIPADDLKKLKMTAVFGNKIEENWKFFGSIEHLNDTIEHYFVPRISYILHYFEETFVEQELTEYVNKYLNEVYKLLNIVSGYYKLRAAKRSKFINHIINEMSEPKFHELTLSQKAILLLLSIKGVTTVLVGARQQKYIDDIIKILDLQFYENAEEILRRLHEELIKANYTPAAL